MRPVAACRSCVTDGQPGVIAVVASLTALGAHAAQDPSEVVGHNRDLSRQSLVGIADLKLPLASPRDERQRGGSIMVAF